MQKIKEKHELSMGHLTQSRSLFKVKNTVKSTLETSNDFKRFNSHQELERQIPKSQDSYQTLTVYEKFNVTASKKPKLLTDYHTSMNSTVRKHDLKMPHLVDIGSQDHSHMPSSSRLNFSQKANIKIVDNSPNRKLQFRNQGQEDRVLELEQELREMKIKYARMVALAAEASGKHPEKLVADESLENESQNFKIQDTVRIGKMAGKVKNLLLEKQKIVECNSQLSKGSF